MNSLLKKLRALSYEARIRILWLATAVAAIILIIVFQSFFRFDKIAPNFAQNDLVESIKAGAQNMQEGLSQLKNELANTPSSLLDLPADYRAAALNGFYTTPEKTLVVNFSAQNPSLDILNFLNTDRDNIILKDGDAEIKASKILTSGQELFPNKILSKENVIGQIIFSLPKNNNLTVIFSDLFFESKPDVKFQETLEIDLTKAAQEIKNALPRE
ncbi:MAG: hypothetical protein AAB871_01780 [Patescibacteria group bacterium]